MPYITTERVKEIREQLKKEFPAFKFSVTKEHHSGVRIAVLKAPFQMLTGEKQHETVNHFYISQNYKDYPQIESVLSRIYAIANEGNGTLVEDGDYGNVPLFYVWMSVGEWDKPFEVSQPATTTDAPNFEKVEVQPGQVQIIEYGRGLAIIGETRPIAAKLGKKGLGLIFQPLLSCGPGWIAPKSRLEEIQKALRPQAEGFKEIPEMTALINDGQKWGEIVEAEQVKPCTCFLNAQECVCEIPTHEAIKRIEAPKIRIEEPATFNYAG